MPFARNLNATKQIPTNLIHIFLTETAQLLRFFLYKRSLIFRLFRHGIFINLNRLYIIAYLFNLFNFIKIYSIYVMRSTAVFITFGLSLPFLSKKSRLTFSLDCTFTFIGILNFDLTYHWTNTFTFIGALIPDLTCHWTVPFLSASSL